MSRIAPGLLFPSPAPHRASRTAHWRVYNLRKALAWTIEKAGLEKRVTLHTLRHTYCATRLQTYHHAPEGQLIQVGMYQVARELGHRSTGMVEHIYGHVAPRPELAARVRYPVKGTWTPGEAVAQVGTTARVR